MRLGRGRSEVMPGGEICLMKQEAPPVREGYLKKREQCDEVGGC